MSRDYHCCATCQHFQILREADKPVSLCRRLGYETRPSYKFKCWTPRPDIVQKMRTEAPASKS